MDTNQIKQNLIQYYDAEASHRTEAGKADWKVQIRQQIADQWRKEGIRTLLELGAGPGMDSQFFQNAGFDVTATDLSPEMVRHCVQKGLSAHVLDFYALADMADVGDFAPLCAPYDSIYALNTLLHVPRRDLPRVLCGIRSVLRPGGFFFVGVYGGVNEDNNQYVTDVCDVPRYFSFHTKESLESALAESFDVLDMQQHDIGGSHSFLAAMLRRP